MRSLALVLAGLLPTAAIAKTLTVGAGQTYAKLSDAVGGTGRDIRSDGATDGGSTPKDDSGCQIAGSSNSILWALLLAGWVYLRRRRQRR